MSGGNWEHIPVHNTRFRTHDHAGNVHREWAQPGGLQSPVLPNQVSSVAPRQSTTGPALSSSNNLYGRRVSSSGGTHYTTHPDSQRPALDYEQRCVTDRRSSTTVSSQSGSLQRVDSGISTGARQGTSTNGTPPTWGQESRHGAPWRPIDHRTGRPSTFDRSEATASPSDVSASQVQMAENLRGLSIREHIASQEVTALGASSASHRNDPILGDVHREHDNAMRSLLAPSYAIASSDGDCENLDPRYKRQNPASKFFRLGRVFSLLWHENAGCHGTVLSEQSFTTGKYNERIFSRIRRMVVIREQSRCCWCVPIATYGGQGAAKPGIDVKKHAIIYMQGARPHRQPGEPQMVKEPIEVEPYAADRKLDRMSRVNFGKIYTVEHNVKVLPVGRITGEFERRLLEYTRSELS